MNKYQIKGIIIKQLFGVYDYNLTLNNLLDDNFFILYGDNGTGKSTILRILYFLLSSKSRVGHKTVIANIPFKEVVIEFLNGFYLKANRGKNLLGDYELEYKGEALIKVPMKCRFSIEDNQYHVPYNEKETRIEKILAQFQDLKILYISDNRKELDTNNIGSEREYEIMSRRLPIRHETDEEAIEIELKKLQEWIINQALSSTKRGEEGASILYEKVLTQLHKNTLGSGKKPSLGKLKKSFEKINQKVHKYVAMGFFSEPDYNKILSRIDGITQENEALACSILTPYLEIQKQKVDALDSLVELISHFTSSLNKYLYKKEVVYSVQDGFLIKHKGQTDTINPKVLSSGEKQLIQLFSKVIRNTDVCSMIIVDEPEISLNIKWQRMLLDSLKYFSKNGFNQFIIATHSIEILSGHLDNLVKLDSKGNE